MFYIVHLLVYGHCYNNIILFEKIKFEFYSVNEGWPNLYVLTLL